MCENIVRNYSLTNWVRWSVKIVARSSRVMRISGDGFFLKILIVPIKISRNRGSFGKSMQSFFSLPIFAENRYTCPVHSVARSVVIGASSLCVRRVKSGHKIWIIAVKSTWEKNKDSYPQEIGERDRGRVKQELEIGRVTYSSYSGLPSSIPKWRGDRSPLPRSMALPVAWWSRSVLWTQVIDSGRSVTCSLSLLLAWCTLLCFLSHGCKKKKKQELSLLLRPRATERFYENNRTTSPGLFRARPESYAVPRQIENYPLPVTINTNYFFSAFFSWHEIHRAGSWSKSPIGRKSPRNRSTLLKGSEKSRNKL